MSDFCKDCLVLKLEEIDVDKKEIDTTLYILYDKRRTRYLVRGQRKWTPKHRSCTYSFECEFTNDLVNFIRYIICPRNKVNEILYNYDNLSNDPNEITFSFLHDYDHSDFEISGYNNKNLNRNRLIKNLRMLRNIFNYY